MADDKCKEVLDDETRGLGASPHMAPSPRLPLALLLLSAALLAPAARGEELARAHVVVTKTLPAGKDGVVQGRPFEILYAVKNVGAEEALGRHQGHPAREAGGPVEQVLV